MVRANFWGTYNGSKLQRAPGLAQGAVEVSQLAQDEAQVVVRRSEILVGIHRAPERIPGLLEALELHQHQADSIPSDRAGRAAP